MIWAHTQMAFAALQAAVRAARALSLQLQGLGYGALHTRDTAVLAGPDAQGGSDSDSSWEGEEEGAGGAERDDRAVPPCYKVSRCSPVLALMPGQLTELIHNAVIDAEWWNGSFMPCSCHSPSPAVSGAYCGLTEARSVITDGIMLLASACRPTRPAGSGCTTSCTTSCCWCPHTSRQPAQQGQ